MSARDIEGLVARIQNRPNDAPMPTEHLLDEAANALLALKAENDGLRAVLTKMLHARVVRDGDVIDDARAILRGSENGIHDTIAIPRLSGDQGAG